MVEPPYGIILNRLKAGKVIPFLGAGASLTGRGSKAKWESNETNFLPSGSELANFLAEESMFPAGDPADLNDLAKVSSYYMDIAGRTTLRDRLREVFDNDYQFGGIHEFLASIESPLVIVSTNYDTLLEQAFNKAGKPYDLVVYPSDRKDLANAVLWWEHLAEEPEVIAPNILDIDLSQRTVIYKMHGSISNDSDWDNYVITEEDYVEFLSRMTTNTAIPASFFHHFRERSFLFLGYGLNDWNLRVVLRNLSKYMSSGNDGTNGGVDSELMPSWAIKKSPTELERKLWINRKVNIFDTDIDNFVQQMTRRA